MKKQFVIYIAGPFRSRKNPVDQWEQTQNIRRAEELSLEVWRSGHVAVCPHLNTAHFQGALPDDVWLLGDLAILARCDGVLLARGWKESAGARREADEAAWLGKPVSDSLQTVILKLECLHSSEYRY